MSNDVRSLFQNILLVSCLPWVIVVDHIRHTVFISTVRHYADMSFEDHNITALPLFRFGNIRGQGSCRVRKKHLQVSHSSEIYVCIRLCNAIFFRMFPNVRVYQSLQIISRIFQGIG